MNEDPSQQEWLRQDNLGYIALIALGLVLVQPFVAGESLDTSGKICVVAFSVAIPLLAALVMVNRQEAFRGRRTGSRVVAVTKPLAQTSAVVGAVAGFWHVSWVAGVGMLAGAFVGTLVHSAGFWELEKDELLALQEADEPDDSES